MYMPSLFGENLFDSFFDDFARPARREVKFREPAGCAMKTDVREKDDAFELDIELPGYSKDNVKAELKDGFLTVSAVVEKNNDEKDKEGRYIRRERYSGSCSRSFYVGETSYRRIIACVSFPNLRPGGDRQMSDPAGFLYAPDELLFTEVQNSLLIRPHVVYLKGGTYLPPEHIYNV